MAGLNDFVVFNDFAQRSFTETLSQQTELWNGATRNALVMTAGDNIGDFMEASQYQLIADLVGNRNAYSTASMSATNLAQLLEVSVKIGGGTKPVEYTGTSFDWTRRPASEAGTVFGERSLPHRQLRKVRRLPRNCRSSSLPHRQLRNSY